MGQTADQLRQEIDGKREDAGQKISAIEAKVEGSVQQVKETVDGTVQQAKDTVDETVVKLKESFDFSKQIEERPLAALGVAIAGGFLLGKITGDGDDHGQSYSQSGDRATGAQSAGQASGIRGAVKDSGLEDTLSTAMGAVMGMVTERVRSVVGEAFPELADKIKPAGDQAPPSRPTAAGMPQPITSTSSEHVASGTVPTPR